jgi:hypothetical protein
MTFFDEALGQTHESLKRKRRVSYRAREMSLQNVMLLAITCVVLLASSVGHAADLATDRTLFHDIYKELVEINTTHSVGDNTLAARRMAKRLRDAGFTETEVQVVEPFPKKGNPILRFKGDDTRRPIVRGSSYEEGGSGQLTERRDSTWRNDLA